MAKPNRRTVIKNAIAMFNDKQEGYRIIDYLISNKPTTSTSTEFIRDFNQALRFDAY